MALRKRLFCDAKPTLLPCKRAAFGMQNNRFCNTLVARRLRDRYVYEKHLYFFNLLFAFKVRKYRGVK
ncbi:hypothetical protein D2S45_08940 [Prevotella intermedia]|uniref:Uncharacterized protein n=1 Tax=Prevotella intermedia TaxID=28131 RepID=A0A424Z6J4_PREIN|nr:hypothetical protein D2S53_08930 [Prevotella intermedia]RRF86889.1 hypothetical protein D2S45_08940 [Prevotella intermedia]